VLRRDIRPFTVAYRGRRKTVPLPGWYPERGREGVFDGSDLEQADAALSELKALDRKSTAAMVQRIRRKLGLSQRRASVVFGGGPRSFCKYESGEIAPSEALLKLLRLVDKHPWLLRELVPT
jgi:HTH-type transcriptional regulator/antitoxin MqsA